MSCRVPLTWGLILCIAVTTAALSTSILAAANGGADGQSGERVVWGTVVKAADDSLIVQPKPPTRRVGRLGARRGAAAATTKPAAPKLEPPPAEQVIAIAKDQTEVAFAQVHRELPMADGTTLRTFIDPVPGTVGDLKPGLPVQVKVVDGVATQILIAWDQRGTIVRTGPDSITYQPEPPADGAKEGAAAKVTVLPE